MSDNHNDLYLSKKDSDVTLVIDETELRAHRSILSEGSGYFQGMFSNNFVEAQSDRIVLNETNLHAFKVVLEYIYTRNVEYIYDDAIDSHSFDKIFAVFACARYYLVDDLAEDILLFVEENCPNTQILNNAIEYSIDKLITSSTRLFQMIANNIVKDEIFEELTPLAVEHLLKHRLNTRESTIFEALVRWMRTYPEDSNWFPHLLDYIDLYLLEEEQLEILFKPTKLVDRNFCQNLILLQQIQAHMVLKLVNLNVVGGVHNLRIVAGIIRWGKSAAESIVPGYGKKEIIVDLKNLYFINCLKFVLKQTAFYTVYVSKDARTWERVVKRSKYICFGRQELYFKARNVRFIRFKSKIRGLMTIDAAMEALYSTKSVKIDPATTITIPKQNVAPTKMLLCNIHRNLNVSGAYITGNEIDGHMEHGIGQANIILQLSQPYIIGSVKLLLKEESSYYIEVMTNPHSKTRWTHVFTEDDVSGWRTATFPKQPVVFIKIVGTKTPSDIFRLYKLECSAT